MAELKKQIKICLYKEIEDQINIVETDEIALDMNKSLKSIRNDLLSKYGYKVNTQCYLSLIEPMRNNKENCKKKNQKIMLKHYLMNRSILYVIYKELPKPKK